MDLLELYLVFEGVNSVSSPAQHRSEVIKSLSGRGICKMRSIVWARSDLP